MNADQSRTWAGTFGCELRSWYHDLYRMHADHRFSGGHPTTPVRDDDAESKDPPPDLPSTGPRVESDSALEDSGDLRRAGDPPPLSGFDRDTPVVDPVLRYGF